MTGAMEREGQSADPNTTTARCGAPGLVGIPRSVAECGPIKPLHNYVSGRWGPAVASETIDDRDPASRAPLAQVLLSGAADVDAAGCAARAAAQDCRSTSELVRAQALLPLRELLRANRDELAELVTLDMGKTLAEACGEVRRGIDAAPAVATLMKGELRRQARRSRSMAVPAAQRSGGHDETLAQVGVNVGVEGPVAWFRFAGWQDPCVGSLQATGSDAIEFYAQEGRHVALAGRRRRNGCVERQILRGP